MSPGQKYRYWWASRSSQLLLPVTVQHSPVPAVHLRGSADSYGVLLGISNFVLKLNDHRFMMYDFVRAGRCRG